jgi:hypothetical protein
MKRRVIICVLFLQACTTKELARMSCENGLSKSVATRENCTEQVSDYAEAMSAPKDYNNDPWLTHQEQEEQSQDDETPTSMFDK